MKEERTTLLLQQRQQTRGDLCHRHILTGNHVMVAIIDLVQKTST